MGTAVKEHLHFQQVRAQNHHTYLHTKPPHTPYKHLLYLERGTHAIGKHENGANLLLLGLLMLTPRPGSAVPGGGDRAAAHPARRFLLRGGCRGLRGHGAGDRNAPTLPSARGCAHPARGALQHRYRCSQGKEPATRRQPAQAPEEEALKTHDSFPLRCVENSDTSGAQGREKHVTSGRGGTMARYAPCAGWSRAHFRPRTALRFIGPRAGTPSAALALSTARDGAAATLLLLYVAFFSGLLLKR